MNIQKEEKKKEILMNIKKNKQMKKDKKQLLNLMKNNKIYIKINICYIKNRMNLFYLLKNKLKNMLKKEKMLFL